MRALRVADRTAHLVEVPPPEAAARGYAGFTGTIGHEFVGVVEDPVTGILPLDRAEAALERAAAPGVLRVLLAP